MRRNELIFELVFGITGLGVEAILGLVATECSLGSDLSLSRCLGRLVDFLVVVLEFVDRAGLFAERDRSE